MVELLCKIPRANIGWRIDYFIVSDALRPAIQSASIHPEIHGSDHCPVELVFEDE